MVLVHHDDAAARMGLRPPSRRSASFGDALATKHASRAGRVVSMKDDWKTSLRVREVRKITKILAHRISIVSALLAVLLCAALPAWGQATKPNIVVIFGDDIGMWNVGAYTHGMMGRTPSIDSIASSGMLFTDHYGQPSCTAGRAAFIMGQLPLRTGMTTIGIPGSTRGIQKTDPTLAEVLKTQGYATGQFGKNHLGDRNEFLPTMHGFDEWFGNLYHLNAEEEPEELDYPGQKSPEYLKKMGPRGVLHTWANDSDDSTTDPKFGRVGKQRIENTGPLTRKRMETFDAEVLGHTLKWMDSVPQGQAVLPLVQHDRDSHSLAFTAEVHPEGGR